VGLDFAGFAPDKQSMDKRLKIGVVGAGVFGGYHANKCASHARVELVGVHDRNPERAEALAKVHGIAALSLDELVAAADAVIVACSASGHAEAALAALSAGKPVLVEKPLADTVESAEAIVAAAEAAGVVLQVGHQERFVVKAIGLDSVMETPTAIRAWRETPPSDRGQDVGVALDLMTHDIDLVLWLMDADAVVLTETLSWNDQGFADDVDLELAVGGARVELHASRIANVPRRVMEIDYPSGQVVVDFNAKTLRHSTPFDLNAEFGSDPAAADSLGAALDAFVRSVLDGEPVLITGGHGLRALRLAPTRQGQALETSEKREAV